MKLKVSVILTAFALFAFSITSNAQRGVQKNDPTQRAEKQTTVLTEKLSLSPSQAEKIKAINLKYAAKHQEQRKESNVEKEKNRSAKQQLHEQQKAEISAVLNKEQLEAFEKMQADRSKNHAGNGKHSKKDRSGYKADAGKRAAHMTERMVETLSLNEEQTAKVKTINLDFATKQQALRTAQKEGRKPDTAAAEKLRTAYASQLKQVLNADQYSQWENQLRERKAQKNKHRAIEKGK